MTKAILSLAIVFLSLVIVVMLVARVVAGFQQRVSALENGLCNSNMMFRFILFCFISFSFSFRSTKRSKN